MSAIERYADALTSNFTKLTLTWNSDKSGFRVSDADVSFNVSELPGCGCSVLVWHDLKMDERRWDSPADVKGIHNMRMWAAEKANIPRVLQTLPTRDFRQIPLFDEGWETIDRFKSIWGDWDVVVLSRSFLKAK